jgi:tellurite resistance protein TehA-like permease
MPSSVERSPGLREKVLARAASLPPSSFSFVMATGITATAAERLGLGPLAWGLFALNLVAYAVLLLLSGVRLAVYPSRLWADLNEHGRAPAFLTTVAGTCVLGTQFIVLGVLPLVAAGLWFLGLALWVVLTYGFFLLMSIKEQKPPLAEGINGTWMLLVVGTQSVSILGTLLSTLHEGHTVLLLGLTIGLFLLGCMHYIILIALVMYRFLFFPLRARELTPPYWINMGAVAITTLSGSLLIRSASDWSVLRELLPFLKGFTLFFWVTSTWWLPLLLALGAWRHLYMRVPLQYDVQYWSMVFPIGMYAVATFRLSEALGWTSLLPLPRVFGFVALGTWLLAFTAQMRRLLRPTTSST